MIKCNCCVCEPVCKYKEIYQNGIGAILNATVSIKREDGKVGFMKVKDCPHIEVSIKCPHMITQSGTIAADVANVKHGEWMDNCNGTFTCSLCGGRASKMHYCGNCGAKMRGVD